MLETENAAVDKSEQHGRHPHRHDKNGEMLERAAQQHRADGNHRAMANIAEHHAEEHRRIDKVMS